MPTRTRLRVCRRCQSFETEGFESQNLLLGALSFDRPPLGGMRSTLISQDVDRMRRCHSFALLRYDSTSFTCAESARVDEIQQSVCKFLPSQI